MSKMKELIVLEWSESQKQFHNSSLGETSAEGIKAFMGKRNPDWTAVGFFETSDAALSASAELCAKRGLVWNASTMIYEEADGSRN
jgi:hypothetical protein